MRIPKLLILAAYFALVVVVGLLAAKIGWKLADDVLALTRPDESIEITISENDTLDSVTAKLKKAGAVKYEWLFKLYCKVRKQEDFFDPGVYSIKLSYDYHALVNYLMASAGNRKTITLMIAEGENTYEIFDLLEKNGVCSREMLEQAAAEYEFDYDFLKRLPYGESNRLEGYLFPDTYEFYLKDEPQNVIGRLLRNFNARLNDKDLKEIERSDYSMHEILIMASIVEAEAGHDDERAKIATFLQSGVLPRITSQNHARTIRKAEAPRDQEKLDKPAIAESLMVQKVFETVAKPLLRQLAAAGRRRIVHYAILLRQLELRFTAAPRKTEQLRAIKLALLLGDRWLQKLGAKRTHQPPHQSARPLHHAERLAILAHRTLVQHFARRHKIVAERRHQLASPPDHRRMAVDAGVHRPTETVRRILDQAAFIIRKVDHMKLHAQRGGGATRSGGREERRFEAHALHLGSRLL